MHKWDEVRTAFEVARLGTISRAAEALGLHRATVVRHIDALEAQLGAKLFQRHARGYVPTEVGEDLFRVARATEEQLDDFVGRTRGRASDVTGELIITSVEIVAPVVMAAVQQFRARHPKTVVRYRVSGQLFKLEYGEAHVAVRSGPKPDHPDNVVQLLMTLRTGLYVHQDYIEANGLPSADAAWAGHGFVAPPRQGANLPFVRWLTEHVPEDRIVFESANQRIQFQALWAGIGVAFYPEYLARQHSELIEVVAPRAEWDVDFWLVTHVDLHRSAKVQVFVALAKEAARPLLR